MQSPALSGTARFQQQAWLQSTRAGALASTAASLLAPMLSEVFGRWCVQVGSLGGEALCAGAATQSRLILCSAPRTGEAVRCEPDRLPIASESADVVVLAHALEFARSPHQLLREADRILSDRGTLFVLGHSAYSPQALARRLGMGRELLPPTARCVAAGRLSDWLELLDYEVTRIARYGARRPWLRPREDGLFSRWAEAYLLVARKRVVPLSLAGRPVRLRAVGKKPAAVGVPAGARREDSR